ncbi:nuclear transport factor 2 family protein [Gymnodinialimonas sp.]
MPDPHTIYQEWLDVTSAALITGDVEGLVSRIAMPFIMRTSTAEMVLENPDDLRSDTRNVVQALKSLQVTHYIRLVKQARYLGEDTIEGWHTTYVLRHAASVTPAYANRMIMRRIDGEWKVTEADHELSDNRLPLTLLRSAPGSFERKWAAAKSNISATHARAEPIYQVFIDSMSEAVNTRDFDTWAAHYTFPHDIHYDATDHVAKAPDDVRAFFEMLLEHMQITGADRMIRTARYAEFLSDDRIFGYHTTVLAKGDETVFGPVKSRMMLTFTQGQWKCSSVTNSLSHQTPSEAEFKLSPNLPTMREIQERMRK